MSGAAHPGCNSQARAAAPVLREGVSSEKESALARAYPTVEKNLGMGKREEKILDWAPEMKKCLWEGRRIYKISSKRQFLT